MIDYLRSAMNRILDTLIGPQSPLLGATRAHITTQITSSNWHCKALAVSDGTGYHYLFINQQICQRSRQSFYRVALQHQRHTCAVATFFELTAALEWLDQCPLYGSVQSSHRQAVQSPQHPLGAMAA